MSAQKPLAIVAGAGAGLGQPLLSRFEQGGFTAIGLGRTAPAKPFGETFWQLAHQSKSTWTHELDLRPASEGF